MQKKEMEFQLKSFCQHLLVHRGFAQNTIENYRKLIRKLITEIADIRPTHEQISEYVVSIYSRQYSYYHIVNTTVAIERYMDFIGDPIKLGRPKKPKRVVKRTLTEAEVAVFIAAAKDIREKAIITLLAYSGIRAAELCNLKLCDVDFGNNEVTINRGKGAKDRIVHIDGECTKVLMAYLAIFARGEGSHLFTTLASGKQYSTWALRRLVKVIAGRTKIDKRIHPHLFRHSLATNLIDRGANVRTVQKQLGHSFLETTMIYVESRPQRVKAEYHTFCPSYL